MARTAITLTVQRKQWLTPHMVRVFLGGPGFAQFEATEDTDAYVKLIFPVAGAEYPDPFDLQRIRAELPADAQPTLRTYTVRSVDSGRGELAIDFVVHGSEGVAGPWAADAEAGDEIALVGPGSGYRPDPEASWHLLAADESGLPALAAALEGMPDTARVKAFIEVSGPDDEIELTAPSGADITWVHRGASSFEVDDEGAGDNAPLVAAVRSSEWLDGDPQVFIHGEAAAVMHNLRKYIRRERSVSAANASISGYWRRGRTEEGFREWKSDLRREEEAAQPAG
ncbi:siderophore-interacting protein [Williamsia sterculiae]|uniref:NADPH-dependent ferric siderophore reductase, contains FAD-binding and SIP domains n=1 Tax=Williamsia sterculiae TaxID=1344003 RepID=A0A1N7GEY5_9NOCA|nr:siderophore-interacting protein [Williamsia sterculiae]SIS11143.1 NADPH-dependent ferric siderophore reductase, contains FAD-binding and SIP domains [Williamsia sterculiae]